MTDDEVVEGIDPTQEPIAPQEQVESGVPSAPPQAGDDGIQARLMAEQAENRRLMAEIIRQQQAPPPSGPPAAMVQPAQEDFTDWNAYQKALGEYHTEQAQRLAAQIREETRATVAVEIANSQEIARVRAAVENARATMPDIDQSIRLVDLVLANTPAMGVLRKAADPSLIDYIAKHPGEAEKMRHMDQVQAAMHIGGLAAKSASSAPVPRAPGAPAIKPVQTGGGGHPKDEFNMTDKEIYAHRLNQLRKR